jgi:hypothetical protein
MKSLNAGRVFFWSRPQKETISFFLSLSVPHFITPRSKVTFHDPVLEVDSLSGVQYEKSQCDGLFLVLSLQSLIDSMERKTSSTSIAYFAHISQTAALLCVCNGVI